MARPSKREQILRAADRCFYEHGITATGVDAVAHAAEVSKRTLYNHFASKEALLQTYIEWRDEQWRQRLAEDLHGLDEPLDRLAAYFDCYVASPAEGYRGCAFINAAAEIADRGSPVLATIARSKERVQDDIEAILVELGHRTPSATSAAIAALLEGSCALSGIRRERIDLAPLKDAALALVHQGIADGT